MAGHSFHPLTGCTTQIKERLLACHRWQGREEVLLESAGKDATQQFKDIGHSKTAQNLVLKYEVGVLQGYTFKKDADVQVASTEEAQKKEMSAFVIKHERMPKYAALVEFIVPLLVAGSYFSYRYLTKGSSMF